MRGEGEVVMDEDDLRGGGIVEGGGGDLREGDLKGGIVERGGGDR